MALQLETRISLRGRKLGGYANWSLTKPNRIRLNVNTMWDEMAKAMREYVAKKRPEVDENIERLATERVFAFHFGVTASHEVLHIVLHTIPEVRRFVPRFREADVHHWVLSRVDEWMWNGEA